jgi:hypothetical protein
MAPQLAERAVALCFHGMVASAKLSDTRQALVNGCISALCF